MASVLAIVSKKLFEEGARIDGRLAGLGQVWAVERYVSKAAGLRPLEAGGSLFLVTVRPPDEALWLVAILEEPRFDGTQWVAMPNAVPIADIRALAERLRFTTGTGLRAEPGKLGMALQTPRVLTADDEALLRAATTKSEPATHAPIPTLTTPKSAPLAPPGPTLDVVAAARARAVEGLSSAAIEALDAVVARAKTAGARAAKAFKDQAQKLGQSAGAVQLLDWGAEALCRPAPGPAAGLFKAARALERKLKLAVDEDARLHAYTRHAPALDTAALVAYAKDLAKAKDAARFDALVDLCVRAVDGKLLELALLDAIEAYAKALKRPRASDAILVERFFPSTTLSMDVVVARKAALIEAIRAHEALADRALATPAVGMPLQPWCDVLEASGALERLRDPDACAAWLEAHFTRARFESYLPAQVAWLDRALAMLGPRLEGRRVRYCDEQGGVDPDVADVCAAHGVEPPDGMTVHLHLQNASVRGETRAYEHLAASPRLRGALEQAFVTALTWSSPGVRATSTFVAWALTKPALRPLLTAAIERVRALGEHGNVASLVAQKAMVERFLVPDVGTSLPAFVEALGALDAATLLQRTLQDGLLDELAWPAQDRFNDGLPSDVRQYATDGPFPYWMYDDEERRRFVVLGPEGEVARLPKPEGWPSSARAMRYVDGDVLYFSLESSLQVGRWRSRPEQAFDTTLWTTWTVGVRTPGGALYDGDRAFRAGQPFGPSAEYPVQVLTDGVRFFDGARHELDPDRGRRIGAGVPAWLGEVEREGGTLILDACTYHPVPTSLAGSPLGVRDGQYGVRVWRDAQGVTHTEGIDGRRFDGLVGGHPVRALLALPEREGLYPVVHDGSQWSVWTPAGGRPIVPAMHGNLVQWWPGAPQWLPVAYWHYLEPRDREGSRALVRCTLEQARALLQAALEGTESSDGTQVLAASGAVTATLSPAPVRDDLLTKHPALGAAIERAFPTVTARRLKLGIAGAALHAARIHAELEQWRESAGRAPVLSGLRDRDALVLTELFGQRWGFAQDWLEASIREASVFLEGDPRPEPGKPRITRLSTSAAPWDLVLGATASLCRRLLAPGTPTAQREQLRPFLSLWAQTPMAQEPARYRLAWFRFASPPAGLDHQMAIAGVEWQHRYVLFAREWQPNRYVFTALERRTGDRFLDPPGAECLESIEGTDRSWGAVEIARALEASTFAHDPAAARLLAERTGLLYASAVLVWAGVPPWPISRELLAELGLKRADVELALEELPRPLDPLYERAAPHDAEAYRAPLDGSRGESAAERLARVWVERFGRREPLDVELVRTLEADFGARKDESFHLDARLLAQPEANPMLTRDVVWVVRPYRGFQSSVSYMQGWIPPGWPKHASQGEEDAHPDVNVAFGGFVLRHFARFVPWAHLELPVGHAARAGAARMAELVTERLRNEELLLLAGAVDLSLEKRPDVLRERFAELRARFEGAPYRAADEGASAPGLDRGDLVVTWPTDLENSLFLAFRPARLDDAAALERLARDLGVLDVFRRTFGGCSCGLNFGVHPVLDVTDLQHYLAWIADGMQRIIERLRAPRVSAGAFEADPRTSAPSAVDALRNGLDLSEGAAALYLQLATLPDPDERRVRRYNRWTAAEHATAARALLHRGLVREAKHQGTDRVLFLAEELAFPEAPAAPLEQSKLPLYGLEPDSKNRLRPPYRVVLPLRPLDELFAAVAERLAAQG